MNYRFMNYTATKAGAIGLALLLAACQDDTQPAANVPEIAQFAVSPTTLATGESATYNWVVDSGSGATCRLDIGSDGSAEYTVDCGAGTQTHTFGVPGSFPATLSVTANAKSSTQTAPVVTAIDGPDGPDGNNSGEGKDVSGTFTRIAWRPTKAVAYGVAEAQVAAVDGKFYMFGGFDSRSPYGCCRPTDRAFSFNPVTETWNRLKPLPPMNGTGHGGVTHSGFATDGKDIYLAGGYTTNKKHTQQIFGTQEVWRYNVADDSYTRLPNLPEARSAGVLEHYGGKLYFFGGSNASRKRDTGELFILDLKSGATGWRRGSPMPNPRNHLASAQLNGLIYAIGGQHRHDGKLTTQADVHRYSPKTDRWERVASLPKAISHHTHATFVVGERIIVMGGEVAHLKASASVYAYDPKTDVWSELTPMPVARVSPVARYVGGKIVVASGWRAQAFIGTLGR